MAYSTARHKVFAATCSYLQNNLHHLRNLAGDLRAVYADEALSGAHAEFTDEGGVTKAQLQAVITFWEDMDLFIDNGTPTQADRGANISPFLVSDPPS